MVSRGHLVARQRESLPLDCHAGGTCAKRSALTAVFPIGAPGASFEGGRASGEAQLPQAFTVFSQPWRFPEVPASLLPAPRRGLRAKF